MNKVFLLKSLRNFLPRYTCVLFLEAMQASCGILAPLALGMLLESITEQSNREFLNYETLIYIAWFLLMNVADLLCSRLSGAIYIYTISPQRHFVAKLLFERIIRYPNTYFLKYSPGLISHRISETSVAINELTGCILFDFWPTFIALSIAAIILFSASPWLGGAMFVWMLIYFLGSLYFAIKSAPFVSKSAEMVNVTNGKVNDALNNHLLIRLFNRHSFENNYIANTYKTEMQSVNNANRQFEVIRWLQFIFMCILVLFMFFSALILFKEGDIGIGIFTTIVGSIINIVNYMHNLSQRMLDFFGYFGKISDGVNHTFKNLPLIPKISNKIQKNKTRVAVEFKNVTFCFEDHKPLFYKLNLKIPAGQKIGIVGPSGAGKSSLLNLLLGVYKIDEGQIYIDDLEVTESMGVAVREQIAIIPQEVLVFNRTIEENIRYGNESASFQEICEAATLANAACLIENLPNGYATLIGESGSKLSGGEMQRITIARALLKKAPILVLDEATASLDALTEKSISYLMSQNSGKKTIIVVSHGMRLISVMDRVIVIQHGRILSLIHI